MSIFKVFGGFGVEVGLIAYFLLIAWLFAGVTIDDNSSTFDNFSIEYHIDSSNKLTIETISQAPFETSSNKFTYGYRKGRIWLRFTIDNQSNHSDFILNFTEAFYEKVYLYTPLATGGYEEQRSGLLEYFESNNPKYIHPKFQLQIAPQSQVQLYMLLSFSPSSATPSFGEVQLYTHEAYLYNKPINDYLLYLFYLGTMFFIMVFNLFVYGTVKERVYLYYAGYIFFHALFILSYSDLIYDMGLVEWRGRFGTLPIPMITLFFALFSMEYLNTRLYTPMIDKFLRIALKILLLLMPLMMLLGGVWFQIITMSIILVSPVLIYGAFYIFIKGYIEIRYYILALILYITSMAMLMGMGEGIMDNSDLSHYGFVVISYIESIIFTFVLANRFRKIQNEIIEIKAKNEIVLEQKVKERTHKISELLKERELLLREIYHRVKNNFQMVISLLWIESRQEKSKTHKESFVELINRVQSMASVHQYLMGSESVAQIDSQEYLAKVVGELERIYKAQKSFEVIQNIEPHPLSIDESMALAPIINEVLTNSIKHYKGEDGCKIELSFKAKGDQMLLIIQDNGEGFDFDAVSKKSFGLKMIKQFIKKLPDANIEYSFEEGTKFELSYLQK